jgi:hypothetical protein
MSGAVHNTKERVCLEGEFAPMQFPLPKNQYTHDPVETQLHPPFRKKLS